MSSTPKEKVSILSLLPTFFHIFLAGLIRVFTAPFRGTSGAPTYKQDVAYAVVRQILSRLSESQSQGLTATTEAVYLKEAAQIDFKAETIDLNADGAKGHWLGKSSANNVMLFFHGGGYIGHATPGHLKYQFALQQAAKEAGPSFSIFSVSYTLAPLKTYPHQLVQAVAALRYLVEVEGRNPQSIFIAGDSAGGNLASALMLHIARPHYAVEPLRLTSRLHGALLISPWISFDTSNRSYTTNATSDYLTIPAVQRASKAFIGWSGSPGTSRPNDHDEYSEPIKAPSDWWADVAENVVDEVMIWGGGGEILIDSIRAYAGTMAEGFAMADAGIQSARTSAAARRSAAQKSGVEETVKKEAVEVTHEEIQAEKEDHVVDEKTDAELAGSGVEPKDFSPDAAVSSPEHNIDTIAESKEPVRSSSSEEHKGDFIVQVDVDDAATRKRLGTERVFYLETPRAAHEEQIMNHTLKIKGKTPSATVIEDWVRSRV